LSYRRFCCHLELQCLFLLLVLSREAEGSGVQAAVYFAS
jgi:hypothetical protein